MNHPNDLSEHRTDQVAMEGKLLALKSRQAAKMATEMIRMSTLVTSRSVAILSDTTVRGSYDSGTDIGPRSFVGVSRVVDVEK